MSIEPTDSPTLVPPGDDRPGGLRRRLLKGTAALLRGLPAPPLERLVLALIYWRAQHLSPKSALRFLGRIDNWVYWLMGQQAVAYGNGVHPKHRLTAYHDFFVERIQAADRVLDVGCGIGAVAKSIAARASANVVAIDLNAKSIGIARTLSAHPKVDFRVGDALTELPPGQFDVIVLSNVLEHIERRPEFLRRLVAVVRPGRLLIRVPCFDRDWRVPLKKEIGIEWRLDHDHKIEYTAADFTAEMGEAGLETVELIVRWGEIWAVVKPAGAAS